MSFKSIQVVKINKRYSNTKYFWLGYVMSKEKLKNIQKNIDNTVLYCGHKWK